jgi:hypothetical protein
MPIVMAGEDAEVVMVHPWQKWYEEVKSGKRTFSFKGQVMEYRFRQDGTWETFPISHPPVDAPKPTVAVASPENRTLPPQKQIEEPNKPAQTDGDKPSN